MATSGFFNTPDFAVLNPGYLLHFDPDEINIQRSRGGQRLGHTSLEIFGLVRKTMLCKQRMSRLICRTSEGQTPWPSPLRSMKNAKDPALRTVC
jgi:hypothetical protein